MTVHPLESIAATASSLRYLPQRLLLFLGQPYRYRCRRGRVSGGCGWIGNQPSWTDTSDATRSHLAICPKCFRRLK